MKKAAENNSIMRLTPLVRVSYARPPSLSQRTWLEVCLAVPCIVKAVGVN